MFAMYVWLLLHFPPVTASERTFVVPMHKVVLPEIGAGDGLTVTVVLAKQPEARVYDILAVPAEKPEIIPVVRSAPAISVLLLLHVPVKTASSKVVVVPAHMYLTPVIADGIALTVIIVVDLQPAGSV
jgi:hypothetical protein